MKEHRVTFLSPNIIELDTDVYPVSAWDPVEALSHNAAGSAAFAFFFTTRITHDPLPDGEGGTGTLKVKPKTVATSGNYYIEGRLTTLDEAEARRDPAEYVLRENMRCNHNPIVVDTHRRWLRTDIFRADDFIVDLNGNITERGDDPKHVAYRAAAIARIKSESKR